MKKMITMSFALLIFVSLQFPIDLLAQTSQSKSPIRIGYLGPATGVLASQDKYMREGITLYFDEVDYRIAGRKVELFFEDTEGKTAAAVSKARKLIEADKVHILVGCFSSSVAVGVCDFAEKHKTPFILGPGGWTAKIGVDKVYHYTWKNACLTGQAWFNLCTHFIPQELGLKKGIVTVQDYVYGHDMLKTAKVFLKQAGVQVIQEVITPFPTLDFSPYLAALNRDADFLLSCHVGAGAVRLPKQFKEYGMDKHMRFIGSGPTDIATLPKDMTEAIGVIGSNPYSPYSEDPKSVAFVNRYKSKYARLPGFLSVYMYETGKIISEAADKLNGNVEDTEAFLNAISEVEFQGPDGLFKFDKETHIRYINEYIWKVVKEEGNIRGVNRLVGHKVLKVYLCSPTESAKIFR